MPTFSPSLQRVEKLLEEKQRPWSGARLRFPRDFEDAFETATRKDRRSHSRSAIIIAAVLFNGYLLLDRRLEPQFFDTDLAIRLLVTVLIAPLFWLPIRRPWILETIDSTIFLPAWIGLVYFHHTDSTQVAVGQMAFMLMLTYVVSFVRPRFLFIAPTIALSVVGDAIYLAHAGKAAGASALTLISIVANLGLIALMASHWLERQERLSFLMRLHIATQNRELAAKNSQLAQLSSLDALTGIPNRRVLDQHLQDVWAHCAAHDQPCSVLMVDIDHFKKLNDRHGHAYGDTVLRVVARSLRDSIRGEQDLAARFGGEEFMVVLPNCSLRRALPIADRICDVIRAVSLPEAPDGSGVRVTVSVGVAAQVPDHSSKPADLIELADQALYTAKHNGRDRVYPTAQQSSAA